MKLLSGLFHSQNFSRLQFTERIVSLGFEFFSFMSLTAKRGKRAFRETERALVALAAEQNAQSVHKFRTSSRRLETLLDQLVSRADRSQNKLLKMLDRIRRRAGKVRDIDLQLAALRTVKIPLQPRRKTQLMHALIELRVKHESRLRKLLKKKAVLELRKSLHRVAKQVSLDPRKDPLQIARQMLADVRPSGSITTGSIAENALHQFRATVKRARYAAELAPQSAESKEFLVQLKHLQDVTGLWHDWHLLTSAATRRLGEVDQSPLVAVLHNITRVKFRHAVSALATSPALKKTANVVPAPEPSQQKPALTLVASHDSAA